MSSVLLAMSVIILIGIVWRLILGNSSADAIRTHLAQSVYHLFLPALVLHVLWQVPVDLNTLRVPLVSAFAVLISLLAAFLIYSSGHLVKAFIKTGSPNKAVGALLLASAFGNFSYLGLPVLSQTFGDWAQKIAIQFDLLASTPLLFTVGIMLARYYGTTGHNHRPFIALLKVPALWAAIAALLLSATQTPMPIWVEKSLSLLGAAVVPLMLLSVGMALRWQAGWARRAPVLLPMVLIQLLLMPLLVWGASIGVGMPEKLLAPVIIEGAMPTMVLGLVICDRFKLDATLYAEAVTVTTALSLLTLPIWLQVVT